MIGFKLEIMLAGLALAILLSGVYVVNSQINARIEAEVLATKHKTRADLNQEQLDHLESKVEQNHERQLRLVQELQKARDNEALATKIVDDSERLRRLTQAKPGLIERQARRATRKVWANIEADSRE